MDDRATNLIYDLFTWFGRVGPIRFVITVFLLFLLMFPLMSWDVSSSLQNTIMPIVSWCLLMQFIKRGHDFGAPAWLSVIVAFSIIVVIPPILWVVMPGDNASNKYGVRRI